LTGSLPNVLVVRADSDIKSVDDLMAKARKTKDGVSYGSAGVGSSQHLAGALFASMIGSQMLHVPYKGSSPSLQALVAGDIDLLFDNITSAVPLIEAGKLRALAVTSSTPADALPGIKPLKELGLKDYDVVSWQAVFAPAGTPKPVVDKLYKAMYAALQKPAVQERLKSLGMTVSGAGPEELGAFQKAEVAKWAEVVRSAGITVN
jgi:tripartite-type tricarboxylate transporter receptor subunit TctC